MAKARSVKLTLNLGPWVRRGEGTLGQPGVTLGGGSVVSLTFVLSKLSQVCPTQFNSALLMCRLLLGRNFASYLSHWAQNWLQRESHERVFLAQHYPTFSQILQLLGPGLMIGQCSGLPASNQTSSCKHFSSFWNKTKYKGHAMITAAQFSQ